MKTLSDEMDKGLRADSSDLTLKMLPSYVTSVPNGSELGNYLALDLGGTNFRVLLIKLDGNKRSEMESKIYHVPHDLMVGDGVAVSYSRIIAHGTKIKVFDHFSFLTT